MTEEPWRETMAESSKLDMALARFEDAVAQLDGVLRARLSSSAAENASEGENACGSAAERENLVNELERLRIRNADLREVNARAVQKVDEAMTRIRALLGGS